MKKQLFKSVSIVIVALISALSMGCKTDISTDDYLRTVFNNLNQIQSATYFSRVQGFAPGDTSASTSGQYFVKEYNNPSDTTIGASFVKLRPKDLSKMSFCYDGNMRATAFEDGKYIVVDSFELNNLPFRPLTPPFFNYIKSILRYTLETKDSVTVTMKDYGDSVFCRIIIFNNMQVEFFGKAFYCKDSYGFEEVISIYEIWINKSNNLPYRYRREMSHDISEVNCKGLEINKIDIKDFKAVDYFMPDYSIQMYNKGVNRSPGKDLTGQVAPDWVLKDVNNQEVSLDKLKSKVVMIQFTSVSCGPCRASIPFLKQLVKEFDIKDFDFVAIEGFNRNTNVLSGYQRRNDFNYRFLASTEAVTKAYQIKAVPVFYILDENRTIRKVIRGYGKDITDKEIRDAINELI
jgi:thiol-disulfide isomerase/thioredoxin